jgi:tRNA1Val (adenine37-N6)-methyltransferase
MKVTTEACLFGALIARELEKEEKMEREEEKENKTLLDIGAGTGLLSLMLAQKTRNYTFKTVELDKEAAKQCKENFQISPWNNRLEVFQSSIQEFEKNKGKSYDIVISNPPFYENQLKGDNPSKVRAHHSSDLSLEELFQISGRILKTGGHFWVLIPVYRIQEAIKWSHENQFHIHRKIWIKSSIQSNPLRIILDLVNQIPETKIPEIEIAIRESDNTYTQDFKGLIEDYYL